MMSNADYDLHQAQLILLANFAETFPAIEFVERIDAVPIDPIRTLLSPLPHPETVEGGKRLDIFRKMAVLVGEFGDLKRELDERVRAGIPGR